MEDYPSLRWVKRQLRRNPVARLSRRRPVLAACVVGSEALGCADEDSDLDIAVIIGGRPSPSSLSITNSYHEKFRNPASLIRWNGRVVDFQFFFEGDAELGGYSKIPLT